MSCGEPVFPAVFRHFYSIFPQKPEGLPLSVPLSFFGSGSENGSNTACGGVGVGETTSKFAPLNKEKLHPVLRFDYGSLLIEFSDHFQADLVLLQFSKICLLSFAPLSHNRQYRLVRLPHSLLS